MKRGLLEALRELVERVSTGIREKAIVGAYLAEGSAVFVHLQRAGGAPADEARYSEDADIQFSRSLMLGDDVVVEYLPGTKALRINPRSKLTSPDNT